MQVSLVLLAFALRGRREIVVRGTAVALQVVESQVGQVGCLLHAQVLERLRLGVNDLVNKLALDLIGRQGVPPEVLVNVVGERFEEGLGNVDVAALLDDFAVDQFGNLGGGIVLGTVQLEGLTSSAVVVQHTLEGATDINGLDRSVGYIS